MLHERRRAHDVLSDLDLLEVLLLAVAVAAVDLGQVGRKRSAEIR